MQTVQSGAEYYDFSQPGTEFSGKFLNPVLRDADHPTETDKKKGDLLGFLFQDANGNETIIGASHAIEKALTKESEGVGRYYRITFLEKTQLDAGRTYNRFKVERFDDEAEFLAYTKPTEKKAKK